MAVNFSGGTNGFFDFGNGTNINDLTEFTIQTVFRFNSATPGTAIRVWSKGQSQMELRTQGNNTRLLYQVFRATTDVNFTVALNEDLPINVWHIVSCVYSELDGSDIGMWVADFEDGLDPLAQPIWGSSDQGAGARALDAGFPLYVGNRPNGALDRAGDISVAGIAITDVALDLTGQEAMRDTWSHASEELRAILETHDSNALDQSPNGYDGVPNNTASMSTDTGPAFPAPSVDGTVAATLPTLEVSSAGTFSQQTFAGSIAATLAAVSLSATGVFTAPTNSTGAISSDLGALSIASTGSFGTTHQGDVTADLAALVAVVDGTVAGPGSVVGSVDSDLPGIEASIVGSFVGPGLFTATVSADLEAVTVSADGIVSAPGTITGFVDAGLEALTVSITGSASATHDGTAVCDLSALAISAVALNSAPGTIAGLVNADLGQLSVSASGGQSITFRTAGGRYVVA